jgi:thiol-disulfide isomerase/thioredoxin
MSTTSVSVPPRRAPRSRRAVAATAVGVACVLALTGCDSMSGGPSGSGSGNKSGYPAGTGEITSVPQGKRPTAPDISGKTLDGRKLSLSDYPGKIIVLNVWGSWCDPCRAEAPNLEAVAKQTAGKGVQFVGIDIDDLSPAQSKSFERRYAISYPSVFDTDGNLLLKFPQGSFTPQAIPNTLILDRRHRIAVRALKALTTDELRKALDPIIAEK